MQTKSCRRAHFALCQSIACLCVLLLTARGISATAQPPVLQGNVAQSAVLNMVKVGQPWNEAAVDTIPKHDLWYRVPNWLAGSWSSDYQLELHGEEKKRVSAKTSGTYGKFRDATGQVWDRVRVPFVSTVEMPETYYVGVVTGVEMLETTPQQLVERKEIEAYLVNKESQRVLGHRHQTQTSQISQHGNEICDIATKSGVTSEVYSNRTAGFSELEDSKMQQDFFHYLETINRPDLIPKARHH